MRGSPAGRSKLRRSENVQKQGNRRDQQPHIREPDELHRQRHAVLREVVESQELHQVLGRQHREQRQEQARGHVPGHAFRRVTEQRQLEQQCNQCRNGGVSDHAWTLPVIREDAALRTTPTRNADGPAPIPGVPGFSVVNYNACADGAGAPTRKPPLRAAIGSAATIRGQSTERGRRGMAVTGKRTLGCSSTSRKR
ncbi:MAG: hypothetical protein MZV70_63570 [Desulfobacterales bacterium]|nr:hypothetical protein [Desulfobacterales bacterium]